MSDDRYEEKLDTADWQHVSLEEIYEVSDFARKYGLSLAEARQLFEKHGSGRAALDAAVQKIKR
jgi:hypothetical protein